MAQTFTSRQVSIAMQSIVRRMHSEDSKISIKVEGSEGITLTDYGSARIYINISSSDRIYMSLESHTGSYSPSIFPWRDKTIKEAIAEIRRLSAQNGTTATQALVKCFPEAINIIFEEDVLNNGKK